MKKMLRAFSVIMAVIMMFSMVAVSVSAEELQKNQEEVNTERFEIPEISAESENASKYVGRVKEQEPNLHTFVFDNGDGTRTMELYKHPVKYVDADGKTKDITTNVKAMADGSYKTADNAIVTTFSKKLSDGINVRHEDINITMKPSNSSTVSRSIINTTAESSDNKTVSYTYGVNTTLEYTLTYTGVKEDIVVSKYTGQTDYHFTLYTNGLVLKKIADTYVLVDEENEIKATIGDIIIITADYKNNTMGEMTYTTVSEGSEYTLRLHIDKEYLSDSNTKYPIRIDPTIYVVSYENDGAGAIEDVTINSLDSSVGTSTSLYVGNRSTYGVSRVLMKFPGIDWLDIYHPSQITSATVELRDLLGEADDMTVQCHVFTGNAWTENTASWSNVNPNSFNPIALSSKSVSYSNGAATTPYHTYSFNITNAVKGWKAFEFVEYEHGLEMDIYDPAKGIIFKANNNVETGVYSYLYKTFGSYNRSEYQPKLTITYSEPNYVQGNSITSGSELELSGYAVVYKFMPSVNGNYIFSVQNSGNVTMMYLFRGNTLIAADDGYITQTNPECYDAIINMTLYSREEYSLMIADEYPLFDDLTVDYKVSVVTYNLP